jgi:pSer/pThr/pTyr-binding forkhead associated (FHA) protein
MTDQVLDILKFVLLGLLYLFFARVLWAVWSEVRTPSRRAIPTAGDPTVAARRSAASPKRAASTPKTARGRARRLVILEPRSRRGLTVELTGEITLGRERSCTIPIDDDAYVSQLHVRFFEHDGQPMVEDLGSTNGTFHNGTKLLGVKLLHPGDRVQVGTTVLEAQ